MLSKKFYRFDLSNSFKYTHWIAVVPCCIPVWGKLQALLCWSSVCDYQSWERSSDTSILLGRRINKRRKTQIFCRQEQGNRISTIDRSSTKQTNSGLFIPLSKIMPILRPEVAGKYRNWRVFLTSKGHAFSIESDDQEYTTVSALKSVRCVCADSKVALCCKNIHEQGYVSVHVHS